MDEQVLRAMVRWPDVPAVYGWLRLDRRGGWHLIDRSREDFDETRDGRGSPITSPPIVEFIHRNYAHDAAGRWFWQNGPQRVFVDLDLAPLILRAFGSGIGVRLVAHTGAPVARIDSGWIGPAGELLLVTDLGPGAVHDLDLGSLTIEETDGDPALILGCDRIALAANGEPAAPGFVMRPRP